MTDARPDEEPLDPAVERVRRKLTRLLVVSTAIMGLGFASVALAVFYRLAQPSDDGAEDGPPAAEAQEGAGERAVATVDGEPVSLDVALGDLRAAHASGALVVLTIGGQTPRIEVRRIADGALVQTFRLAPPNRSQDPSAAE